MALSPRQIKIFDFIRAYRKKNRCSPTLREIADHFSLSSLGTVHKHVKTLVDNGLLAGRWNERRGLVPSSPPGSPLSPTLSASPLNQAKTVLVPFLGVVRAGAPLEVFENREEIPIPEEMLGRGETFVLKVEGDSMIDEFIAEGDLIIVEARKTANNGEMVVATVQEEKITLKRLFREGNRIRLQPSNRTMAPLFYAPDDVSVNGVVIGLLRRYR